MWTKLIDFLSRLLPAGLVTDLTSWVQAQVERRGAAGWGMELFITAMVLIVIALAVDAALYWSRQEHRDAFMEKIERIRATFRALVEAVQSHLPSAKARAEQEERIEQLQAIDEQLQETEDTLEQFQEELTAAIPLPPEVETEVEAAEIPEIPPVDVPMETEIPAPVEEVPPQEAIQADVSGFSAPRRARRRSGRDEA